MEGGATSAPSPLPSPGSCGHRILQIPAPNPPLPKLTSSPAFAILGDSDNLVAQLEVGWRVPLIALGPAQSTCHPTPPVLTVSHCATRWWPSHPRGHRASHASVLRTALLCVPFILASRASGRSLAALRNTPDQLLPANPAASLNASSPGWSLTQPDPGHTHTPLFVKSPLTSSRTFYVSSLCVRTHIASFQTLLQAAPAR